MARHLIEVQTVDGNRSFIEVKDSDPVDPRMLRSSGLIVTGREARQVGNITRLIKRTLPTPSFRVRIIHPHPMPVVLRRVR